MCCLAVALAVAGAWFDANVAGGAKWPSGADPVEMAGTGTWDGRRFVTQAGKTVAYDEAFGAGLSFAPAVTRDAADGEVTLTTEMTFTARRRLAVPDGAKAAITVLGVAGGYVGGVEIPAEAERIYEIPTNAFVTVAFSPEEGAALSSSTMLFQMTQAMTLPETGRPTPIPPTAITVSEFMAAPTNGCDWVELRNAANVDVDVAGWLITDDYTKKISKWKAIEGRAIVANGTAFSSCCTIANMRSGSGTARPTATRRSTARPSMRAT